MTAPQPLSPYELAVSRFCAQCEIRLATVGNPLCPVCLDKRKRGEQ